jgi:hypothetical protein
MEEFSARFLSGLGDVDGFLLKSRSPSCGVRDAKVLHSDAEEAGHESGPGLFAARVLERFPAAAVEDEVRLTSDQRVREHFLTKLFTLARLREALAGQTRAALAGFHASHELLLSAHDEQRGRRLGRLLEGAPARPPDALADEYRSELVAALARPPHPGRIAAVLARSVDGPALARQMLLAPYPEPLTRGDARFQGLSGAVR